MAVVEWHVHLASPPDRVFDALAHRRGPRVILGGVGGPPRRPDRLAVPRRAFPPRPGPGRGPATHLLGPLLRRHPCHIKAMSITESTCVTTTTGVPGISATATTDSASGPPVITERARSKLAPCAWNRRYGSDLYFSQQAGYAAGCAHKWDFCVRGDGRF